MQKYDFITLDIFRKNIYNRGIQDELDDNTVEYMIDELQGIADDAIERLRQAKERADKAEEEKRQLERKYQELLARLEESGKV